MSSPVAIPRASSSRSASPASSPGLYVPVHKRSPSTSRSASSRSTSPASERTSTAARPLTYSRETLLSLASSPLARLAPETRDSIRNALPELIMNRKMRKAIEYHATQLEHQKRQQQQQERAAQPTKFTRSPVPAARRSRPIGRAPERRRNALEKLVDDQSWRAMRMPASPILI